MKSGTAVSTAVKVIVYVLLSALMAGAIAFALKFTNGGTTALRTFYLQVGGDEENIITRDVVLYLRKDEPLRLTPKYTFGELADIDGFSYKIVPKISEETKFEYTAAGGVYAFTSMDDATSAFTVEEDETSITVINDFERDDAVGEAIERLYEGKDCDIPKVTDAHEVVYFELRISNYNESMTYNIGLLFPINVKDLTLDRESVVYESNKNK